MDIMTATLRMAARFAFRTGTDQIVACIVRRGMTLGDITSAMRWTGVGAVWKIGTVLNAPYTAPHGTHWKVITPVTLGLEAKYVFPAGMAPSVTRVSILLCAALMFFFISTDVSSANYVNRFLDRLTGGAKVVNSKNNGGGSRIAKE